MAHLYPPEIPAANLLEANSVESVIKAFECLSADRALVYLREYGDRITIADAAWFVDFYAQMAASEIALETIRDSFV